MRHRHRIPSIFNLSMVDVLCCALGCVILLWLLNLRNATEKSIEAGQTSQELTESKEKLALRVSELEGVLKERSDLKQRLQETLATLADVQGVSKTREVDIANLSKKLEDLLERLRTTETTVQNTATRLAAVQKEYDAVTKERDDIGKDRTAVARERDNLIKDRDAALKERDALRLQVLDLNKKSDLQMTQLKDANTQIAQHKENARILADKFAQAQTRVVALEKDLKDKEALLLEQTRKAESLPLASTTPRTSGSRRRRLWTPCPIWKRTSWTCGHGSPRRRRTPGSGNWTSTAG